MRQLFRINLQGFPVAAVGDCYISGQDFAERWGLAPSDLGYFNSGVLLIDLKQVREGRLFTKALAFIVEHGSALRFTDQDALNYVFWNRWLRLPMRWNVQRHMVIPSLTETLPPELRLRPQRSRHRALYGA